MSEIDAAKISELLPCPFCGGKAERIDIEDGDNVGGSCVTCTTCNASGNVEFGFKENFVSNWNRRAPVADWQPIETAPRDGTRFLTWDSYYGVRMGRAFMRADHDDWLSYVDSNGSSHKGGIRASHWMPLPAAPVDGGEDA